MDLVSLYDLYPELAPPTCCVSLPFIYVGSVVTLLNFGCYSKGKPPKELFVSVLF